MGRVAVSDLAAILPVALEIMLKVSELVPTPLAAGWPQLETWKVANVAVAAARIVTTNGIVVYIV